VHSTGKIYQRFIRRGYARGKNFISVSEKTRADLHHFLGFSPAFSKVVYNGLTQEFKPFNGDICTTLPSIAHDIDAGKGYILHVGGNQWYKNRVGVIEIYNAWRKKFNINLPLVLLGAPPDRKILNEYCESPVKKDIYLLSGKCDAYLRSAYAQASVFLFPSIAEGFGWPIAEAMASGCPVITTGIAPMTEVAGDAAFLIDKRPLELSDVPQWADMCANTVNKVVTLPPADRKGLIKKGIKNSERFKTAAMLAEIERLYADAIMAAEA
jgi:glycosyltransferase involved in cell wall biosynthesis